MVRKGGGRGEGGECNSLYGMCRVAVCLSLQVLVCREYVEQYKEVEFA